MLTDDLASRVLDLSLASARPVREIEIDLGSSDTVRVPDARLMFQGEYRKEGFDLVIENETTRVIVNDYFRAAKRPVLESPEGARLTEEVVAALATSDHGLRYAQATAPAQQAAIGRVETVTGQATVIRNGTPVVLNQGDLVFKGDVVQTDRGSSLGITFIDGSTFSLASGARMVLNDMVYQPGGAQNSALLNIVQGSVTFLAGQVAKTGEMRVGTPVATMGIRGTLVNAEINADNGQTRFSVLREPNGEVGRYDLIRDGRVIATVSAVDQVTVVAPSGIVTTEPKSFQQQQAEELLVQQVFQIFSLGQANPLLPGTGPTGPGPGQGTGGGGGGSSTNPDLNGATDGGTGFGPVGPGSPSAPPVPLPDLRNPDPPSPNAGDGSQRPSGGGNTPAQPPDGGGDGPPPFAVAAQVIAIGEDEPTGGEPGALFGAGSSDGNQRVVSARASGGGAVPVAPGDDATLVSGQYGTFAVRQDGTYSYVPFRANSLGVGDSARETFEYVVEDGTGRTATTTISFDITGENDAPVVAGPVVKDKIFEDTGVNPIDLLEGASDVDNGHSLRIENLRWDGHSPGELPPGITLSPDGKSLLVDTDHPAYDDLVAGDAPRLFTFTYEVVDEHGARVTQTARITISPPFDGSFETGFTGWDRAGETAVVAGGTSGSQAARITTSSSSSIDFAEIETFLGVPAGSLARDESATHSSNDSTVGSAIRTIAIRLEAGQSFRFDWNFSTSDYNPFNDFAVFTIDELNAIFELADVESVGNYGSTGWRTFTFTAREAGEYHFGFAVLDTGDGAVASTLLIDNVRLESNGAPILTGAVIRFGAEESGTFAADLLSGASDPEGSALHIEALDWHNSPGTGFPPGFSLAADGRTLLVDTNDPAFQSLAQGQSRTYDFDYDVVDASGARTTQTAKITVTGTNDGPVAVADIRSVAEDATSTGNVLGNDSDPDSGDSLTVTGIRRASDTSGSFTSTGSELLGTYGRITVNADGSYTYVADQAAAQALPAGAQVTDTFTYRVVDEHGATTTETLTFTVTGTNDAAVIAGDRTGTVTENDATYDSGSLTVADPDGNDTLQPVTNAASENGYGTYSVSSAGSGTFSWSYTLDDGDPAVHALGQDATLTDYFYVTSDDGTQQRIDITITGTNDAPIATADIGSVTEDGSTSGNVLGNDSDPDSGDSLTVTGIRRASDTSGSFTNAGSELLGTYGRITVNADGSYTYVADRAAAQALPAGAQMTDTFTYRVVDEHGAATTETLTFTITGTNDAPVANDDLVSAADSDPSDGTPAFGSSVLANDIDPDQGDTLKVTGIKVGTNASGEFASLSDGPEQVAGLYGDLTIFPDGTYFYSEEDSSGAIDTFTYRIADASGATSEAVLQIDRTGGVSGSAGPVVGANTVMTTETGTFFIPDFALLFNDHPTGADDSIALESVASGSAAATYDSSSSQVRVSVGSAPGNYAFSYKAQSFDSEKVSESATVTVVAGIGGTTLSGTNGSDILHTARSGVSLQGGFGNDFFVLGASGADAATILDFEDFVGETGDVIDVTAIVSSDTGSTDFDLIDSGEGRLDLTVGDGETVLAHLANLGPSFQGTVLVSWHGQLTAIDFGFA